MTVVRIYTGSVDVEVVAVLGELLEVYPGQALKIRGVKTQEPMDIFVMDPEPFRGHEGMILCIGLDLEFALLPAVG